MGEDQIGPCGPFWWLLEALWYASASELADGPFVGPGLLRSLTWAILHHRKRRRRTDMRRTAKTATRIKRAALVLRSVGFSPVVIAELRKDGSHDLTAFAHEGADAPMFDKAVNCLFAEFVPEDAATLLAEAECRACAVVNFEAAQGTQGEYTSLAEAVDAHLDNLVQTLVSANYARHHVEAAIAFYGTLAA